MQLPIELERIQRQLNAADVVHAEWYRRNHGAYEVICYVNNIAGLVASGNSKLASVFIKRADEYLRNGSSRFILHEM